MKQRIPFIAALLLLAQALWAQESGVLTGRVLDKELGEVLPAATVYIEGTDRAVQTDWEGIYSLRVPADEELEIVVEYLGYRDSSFMVTVPAGKTISRNINLRPKEMSLDGDVVLQAIEVKGLLQGQARALNRKKTADQIVEVVSAEQMGRFPDQNAAEAMQRVTGVNVQNDQGEGRYVLVRGLSPQFTNININGEQIPSPEADVRFVALDVLSSSQLSSMEISKTLTPDMDGDAIGGSVNLITRTAVTKKPEIQAVLAGGYNQLMGRGNYNGSLQYGQRFGEEQRWGVMLNGNYYNNELGSDNWEREPFDNELELRDYELIRSRAGLSSTIDYKFNTNSKIYLRGIYSRFTDREWRRRYVFKPEDEEIERNTKDRQEEQSILAINLGGAHTFPKLQLDYEVQYSYGEQNTPFDNESAFIASGVPVLNFENTDFPSFEAPEYLQNNRYEFDALETGNTLAQDQNVTAKFNVGIPYKLSGNEGLFKFGAKLRSKQKSYDIAANTFENLGGVPNLDAFQGGLLDNSFLSGRYTLSPALDMPQLLTYFNENPQQFELQVEDKSIDEAQEAFLAREDVYAGYAMARQRFDKLLLVAGVRYEYTRVDYESQEVIIAPNGDLSEIRPIEGTNQYGFFLPQINAKYQLNKNTNLRAAATFSYARPNFGDIVPAQELNREDNEAVIGNPDLRPVRAFNLDLLGEHYYKYLGILSGGVFYKNLQDFIYPRVLYNRNYPFEGAPIATGINVTQVQNGEQAHLLGSELALQRPLDFLPGHWKKLKVYLNYTYTYSASRIQSRAEGDEGTDRTERIRLPGQAAHVGNASLAYQSNKVMVRAALNFNGSYLDEVGGQPEEDLYIKERMQLDVSASYFFNKNTIAFIELLNLTDQPFEAYIGDRSVFIQREFYGAWGRIGVKLNLR